MRKVTIEDIEESLYDAELDTEYREALAHALMELKYVDDTPLRLSYGTPEQQKQLNDVYTKSLSAKEIKKIIGFIANEMKDDFQYGKFSEIERMYMNIADKLSHKEKGR